MSRRFVAFAVLALVGTVLVVPDPSFAGAGGIRGGFRAGGFRAPAIIHRNTRAGILRSGHAAAFRGDVQLRLPAAPRLSHGLARTTVRAPFARLERRHHRRFMSGYYVYPSTIDGDSAYIGTPYDPSEAIPVYGPPPFADLADPPPPFPAPRFSSTREDNQEACRSERVTVPASEGEREITVVRC